MSSNGGSTSRSSSSSDSSPNLSPRSPRRTHAVEEDVLNLTNLKLMKCNDQISALQTVIRDQSTSRSDFLFYADRLIRLVVEEGLNCMPAYPYTVTTPTGKLYEGLRFNKMNCAVSIVRNGEAMEQGLRDCCRSIRIGKILIRRDPESKNPRVYYAKFPPNIENRIILLLYPVLESGGTVKAAVRVLKEHGVDESNIFFVNLFSSYHGTLSLLNEFPHMTMLTSQVHEFCPNHFGQKYFGSD